MTASNNMVAKLAAALAVVGLVASSVAVFAPAANAQTTTEVKFTFTRDLTIGSTGADVTALQTWLINRSYGIPAGATGYFGAQTQAALAKYQAAKGISPAAGYFGPITRNSVASEGGSTGGTGTGTGTGSSDLSGGEADLSGFKLVREDGTGNEGEEEVSAFTAEFDVEDGDVRVERMEIMASSTVAAASDRPWDYFDRVSVWVDGDEIADMDVDARADWDEEDDGQYRLNLTGLDYVVEDGDTAEITIAFDVAGSIDTSDLDQKFDFWVPNDGIRAVDGEGIQQYTGKTSDKVSFDFGAEENGDLRVRASSEDPEASILVADDSAESDEYTVFVFNVDNREDVDTLVTDLEIGVADNLAGSTTQQIIRRATLVADGDEYDGDIADNKISFDDMEIEVGGDDDMDFELMITLARNAPNATLTFDVNSLDAEGVDSGNDATVNVGSFTSETHTVALTGVAVKAVSTSQAGFSANAAADSYATHTIKFDVSAIEDDAFIATTTGTGSAAVVYEVGGNTFTASSSAVLTSTAATESGYFRVDEGDSETFTLTVTLNPAIGQAAGSFDVRLVSVTFNDDANATTPSTFTVSSSDSDYRTDPVYINN